MVSLFQPRPHWRDQVKHDTPKALRIRAAVKAIHERGEYPGLRRTMRELGEPMYRETSTDVVFNGEPLVIQTPRWMSGRDNVVRKQMMRELGINPEPGPEYDYDYWY